MDDKEHELIRLLRSIKDPDYKKKMMDRLHKLLNGEVDADEVLHQPAN